MAAEEEEEVLELFDSYWFDKVIFSKKPPSVLPHETASPAEQIQEEIQEPNFLNLPTLHIRSLSEQLLSPKTGSFLSADSVSPSSVITTPKLQTVHSGKEIREFSKENVKREEGDQQMPVKKKVSQRKRIRRKLGSAKSLSHLEFEELKGFMDLGFVFSEKDKDSSLVSIIPGLQRLGRIGGEDGKEEEEEGKIDEAMVPRPYLSEAWDVLDLNKVENPLMTIKVPAVGNEMDMKNQLRFWAQTVASTVR